MTNDDSTYVRCRKASTKSEPVVRELGITKDVILSFLPTVWRIYGVMKPLDYFRRCV